MTRPASLSQAEIARAKGGRMTTPDLITTAEAVTRLWDLLLFTSGTAEARQKRADVMHEAVTRLQAALQWCSGSDDFQEGGKAREGWLKVCAPLLDHAALSPREGEG